jgi:hypothetical protein
MLFYDRSNTFSVEEEKMKKKRFFLPLSDSPVFLAFLRLAFSSLSNIYKCLSLTIKLRVWRASEI